MKKLLLIILILLPCNLGAQEGCGDWFRIRYATVADLEGTRTVFLYNAPEIEPDSVWIPKPCPDIYDLSKKWMGDTLIIPPKQRKFKFSHFMFEVWNKQPCNPGGSFKLFCPPSKLDSSVVREAMCEEDYYTNGNYVIGWFPCYCLILDGVRYWMKENPLQEKYREEK